jgi:excisionase family DNA binding protein
MHTDLEPVVDADQIAALLGESRRNVVRMAREGKITAYLMSGVQRHTYKFKRSEVTRFGGKAVRPLGRRMLSLLSRLASASLSL